MTVDKNHFDLVVIGTGMAGSAAAVFAAERGLDTAQVGETGEIIFASGYLDLLGVHPVADRQLLTDPWAGLQQLAVDEPLHPLARLAPEKIRLALEKFAAFLKSAELPYCQADAGNMTVLTPLGTTKPTYFVPETMQAGVAALREKQPCLLVDIRGLRGFSARQIAAVWKNHWPTLQTVTIDFPESEHLNELYTETMARQLELPAHLEQFGEQIRPHLKDVAVVGLPAILGIRKCRAVAGALADLLKVPVFEIPTMPPGVPGLRLREAFAARIPELGVQFYREYRVLEVTPGSSDPFTLSISGLTGKETLQADRVLLATGRFLGKGLQTDQDGIHEALFNLPVFQPGSRAEWHRKDFLDPRGHVVNRAGLAADDQFRPLAENGQPVFANLYAAGSILAHQDWMRAKCGSGLAIATAYAAVEAIVN